MIRVLAFVLASAAASVASAQLVFDGTAGVYSGGGFDSSLVFLASPVTLDSALHTEIVVTASSYGANGFSMALLDENFTLLANMVFTSLDFSAPIPYGGNLTIPAIAILQFGPADLGQSYSMDISSVVAIGPVVPEPSTVALIAGGVALAGAVVYRRRKTA